MKELTWDETLTLLSPHSYTLASTIDADGRPNLMGVGWWTFVSWDPQMVAMAIGKSRYTRECLDHCAEFALCFPSVEQVEGAWLCGKVSGRRVNKVEKGGFVTEPSLHIRPPVLSEATLNIECRVANRVECGDHYLYIGEVLATRGDPDRKMHLYTIHYKRPVGIDHDLNVEPALGFERLSGKA